MNISQKFLAYVAQAENLVRRYPKVDWKLQLSQLFLSCHRQLLADDPDAYSDTFVLARAEVARRVGVVIEDLSLPF